MISFFPKKIATTAILTYAISLALVSLVFSGYAIQFKFMAIGLAAVSLFFIGSASGTKKRLAGPIKYDQSKIFWYAFAIRLLWVVFSWFFYIENTGQPFEWGAADSRGYHDTADWFRLLDWPWIFNYLFAGGNGVSDTGYVLWLTTLYKTFGANVFLVRLIKAALGAWTCVLIYKAATRTFGSAVGRMAGFFCAFMPNMIYWCGIHTKETEMVFIVAVFINGADKLLRSRKYSFGNIAVPTAAAFALFFFRTVLGAVAVFSFCTALLFASERIITKGRRLALIAWGVGGILLLSGGVIMTEIEKYWELRVTNEIAKREHQATTSQWAKYATGTIMAPMVVVLPFSTMVDTEQYNQLVVHGGNFVKNFMSIFVIFAIVYAFKNKKWRDYSLIGSFFIAYLAIISFSGYANAERFHMPALPIWLMLAAYGVSQLNAKNFKYVSWWYAIVVVMEFAWAFFKIGSRGLL